MPATLDRRPRDDNDPRKLQFGKILEKIKRRGHESLTGNERMFVVEIFRAAAMTNDPKILRLRDEISAAHLEFCFRLPTTRTAHDA
jgi:hypothetical protein